MIFGAPRTKAERSMDVASAEARRLASDPNATLKQRRQASASADKARRAVMQQRDMGR